jgi:hypothetical protein
MSKMTFMIAAVVGNRRPNTYGRCAMFPNLTRRYRLRAAVLLAALYAFCVLLPPAALALTHAAAHCLTDSGAAHVHGKTAVKPHAHADGTAHAHHDQAPHEHSDASDKAQNCCGLFCISAMPHGGILDVATPLAVCSHIVTAVHALDGSEPGRLRKPPRT